MQRRASHCYGRFACRAGGAMLVALLCLAIPVAPAIAAGPLAGAVGAVTKPVERASAGAETTPVASPSSTVAPAVQNAETTTSKVASAIGAGAAPAAESAAHGTAQGPTSTLSSVTRTVSSLPATATHSVAKVAQGAGVGTGAGTLSSVTHVVSSPLSAATQSVGRVAQSAGAVVQSPVGTVTKPVIAAFPKTVTKVLQNPGAVDYATGPTGAVLHVLGASAAVVRRLTGPAPEASQSVGHPIVGGQGGPPASLPEALAGTSASLVRPTHEAPVSAISPTGVVSRTPAVFSGALLGGPGSGIAVPSSTLALARSLPFAGSSPEHGASWHSQSPPTSPPPTSAPSGLPASAGSSPTGFSLTLILVGLLALGAAWAWRRTPLADIFRRPAPFLLMPDRPG